ncbi:MAG: tetratricopeptide repeat protein [Alphaproteobacteria bacterium]|nr:tetratricopeptide repeat protein [Alphaproteobacteria bacterium]
MRRGTAELRIGWPIKAVWSLAPASLALVSLAVVSLAVAAAHAADGRSAAGLAKSLAIEESRTGPSSPHLLPLLDRLAGAQIDDGALADAAASRRRALRIALRSYGGQSPNAALAMVSLAAVELLRHRYNQAEPLLIAELPALSAKFGDGGAALAGPLAGLARIALARGDLPGAKAWAARALAIAQRSRAAMSGEPWRVLAAIDAAEDRFDDGERMLRAALARDGARDPAGLETARDLAQLAGVLLRAKRFDEALPAIEQAAAIDQAHLSETHPLVADDFTDLGLIYAGLGRDDAAAAALGYALALLDHASGQQTPRVAYVELALAPVLRRLGAEDDAKAAFGDAKRILESAADDEQKRERQL